MGDLLKRRPVQIALMAALLILIVVALVSIWPEYRIIDEKDIEGRREVLVQVGNKVKQSQLTGYMEELDAEYAEFENLVLKFFVDRDKATYEEPEDPRLTLMPGQIAEFSRTGDSKVYVYHKSVTPLR